jgi:hypothetical protein
MRVLDTHFSFRRDNEEHFWKYLVGCCNLSRTVFETDRHCENSLPRKAEIELAGRSICARAMKPGVSKLLMTEDIAVIR